MRINHNIAAMNTHRQLVTNQGATAKSLEKLSSGLKINRAGDDAAGLAISEKMRGQIRGLDQASNNANDAISLIKTAEGGLNETHSILQRMRELSVQAANGTNQGTDRDEIQKEVAQLTQEITRIATDTEFNKKKLLDGTFGKQITGEGISNINFGSDTLTELNITVTRVLGSPAEGAKPGTLSTKATATIGSGMSGGTVISNGSGSGTITVNGVDVKTTSGMTLTQLVAAINTTSGSTVTATVKDGGISLENKTAGSGTITVTGGDKLLTSANTLKTVKNSVAGVTGDVTFSTKATATIGTGMSGGTVISSGAGSGTITVNGVDVKTTSGMTLSGLVTAINAASGITVTATLKDGGISLENKTAGSGTITVTGGDKLLTSANTLKTVKNSVAGVIGTVGAEEATKATATIGSGMSGGTVISNGSGSGTITVNGVDVKTTSGMTLTELATAINAASGITVTATVKDGGISLENKTAGSGTTITVTGGDKLLATANSLKTVKNFVAGKDAKIPDVPAKPATSDSIKVTIEGVSGDDITYGENGKSVKIGGDSIYKGTSFTVGADVADNTSVKIEAVGSDVKMQIGANEGQTIGLSVAKMDAASLGVSKVDVSTVDGASKAISTIDDAIASVSSERSKLGAKQNRLEHTINNLGTASENASAAESRIRDVDMAKEMMEFTKNNILSQAAQSMLAQANQQPQGVLQLLQ